MRRRVLACLTSILSACAFGVEPGVEVPLDAGDASPPPAQPKDSGADTRAPFDAATDAPGDASAAPDAQDPDAGAPDASVGGSVWGTATCDGAIGVAEYGGLQNQLVTGGNQRWYATWDAQNLYVGVENANVAEGLVVYVGHGLGGATCGQPYDNTMPNPLSFQANAVVYAKQGYSEVRTANKNAWSKTGAITMCSGNNGTTRELVLPWAALGANGLPASFRFAAYVTSANGWVYGQIPTNNPGGQIGMNATFPHDFWVQSTANGSGDYPFSFVE